MMNGQTNRLGFLASFKAEHVVSVTLHGVTLLSLFTILTR